MKNKKTPDIRFKGFTDDWEQRKLGDVFEEYSEKGQPELPAMTIVQGGGTIRRDESDRNLQYDKESLANYKVVYEGDFIVHLRSFEGGLEKATALGIISPAYHTFRGNGTDSRFYYVYFRSPKFIDHDLKPHVYGIRDGRSIDIEGMKTIEIPWANREEQMSIGNFIDNLNSIITLHQRKLEKLKNFKKAMLEKMFPKNGKKTPEIRFQGFTNDWEQRKLGELVEFNPSEELPDEFEYVDLESVVGTEMISHRHENKVTAPSRAQRVACQGDLFYQTVRPYQKNNYLFDKPDNDYVFSTGYAQMRPYIDGHFLLDLVQTERFVKIVLDNCTGTSYPAINANDLASIKITYPQCRSEQQTIGVFLASIDTLITLHQRKLEKLQQIKKAMLEKMFV